MQSCCDVNDGGASVQSEFYDEYDDRVDVDDDGTGKDYLGDT